MAWPILGEILISLNFQSNENLGPRRRWVPPRPVDVDAAAAAAAFVVCGGFVLCGGGGGGAAACRRGGVVIIVVVGGGGVRGGGAAIICGGGIQLSSGTGTPGTWNSFIICIYVFRISIIDTNKRRGADGEPRNSKRRNLKWRKAVGFGEEGVEKDTEEGVKEGALAILRCQSLLRKMSSRPSPGLSGSSMGRSIRTAPNIKHGLSRRHQSKPAP